VLSAESALREAAQPHKVNLASLGNVVPHLHWHVIPRWRDDRHFPDPIWAAPRREAAVRDASAIEPALTSALTRLLPT
jgi:diadenosine tetraphosphate (Ap4A) HIT family hydrolase